MIVAPTVPALARAVTVETAQPSGFVRSSKRSELSGQMCGWESGRRRDGEDERGRGRQVDDCER